MDPLKILLVDDSKTARYKLRLALQEQGVEVQTAESAESALSQVRQLNPDAILMDHTMPGMTGLDALEILKGDAETSAIPVVMCSAHEDEAFAARAKRLGALGILPKSDPAETAKKLPGTLHQIRQNLASAFVSAAPAAAPAAAQRPPERRAAATAPRHTPTPAASQGQIDSMLARRLGTLEQELRAEIETRCQTLEQNIATSERILIHRIEQATAPTPKPGSDQSGPIAAEAARLAAKELPALIEQRLDQERQRLLDELQAKTTGGERAGGSNAAIRKLRVSQYALSAAAALIGAGIAIGVSFMLG